MPLPSSSSTLDSGPPLPPGLSAAPPSPSLSSLSGASPQQPGGASLQQAVIEKLMGAEALLRDAAGIMPQLSPIVDDITMQLRAKAGRVLVGSTQPQAQPSPMMMMGQPQP